MASVFRIGPLGAVALTEIDGVVVVEARVSIAGTVPQFLLSGFAREDA